VVGASLQAAVALPLAPADRDLLDDEGWAELAIVSRATVSLDLHAAAGQAAPRITPAEGTKCARCWKVLEEVGSDSRHPTLCLRCADAVESGLMCGAVE